MKLAAGMPNEPPDWWKRWRPLRWLGALIVLLLLGRIVSPMLPSLPPRAAVAPPRSHADARAPVADAAPRSPGASESRSLADDASAPANAAFVADKRDDGPLEVIEDEPITSADVLAAYTARPPDAQRLTFFSSFRSYAPVDASIEALEKAGYEPQHVSRQARVPDGVPPSDLDILTVKGYRHLDQAGTLELQFFNDRLYQVEFEPDDAAAYRTQFRRRWPQLGHEKSGRSEIVSGALRVASSLDLSISDVGRALNTRPYVVWQDLRLVHQRDDWDYQFAKAAAR